MSRKVVVCHYCPDWPALYEEEAAALVKVFGEQVVAIHHFGSTSIPGICAKPIIDILMVVHNICCVDELNDDLYALGYHAKGEYGIPGRRFFYKGTEEVRTHHLHVYQVGCEQIERHLAFRDYMRSHPTPAKEYARLKIDLAQQFPDDMENYIAGKNDFVQKYEKRALKWYQKTSRRTVLSSA